MLPLKNVTLQKISGVIRMVDTLLGSDFPYDGPEEALSGIRELFIVHSNSVGMAREATVVTACRRALDYIDLYIPLLGFILRSTNVRNSFELHGPLLRLAQRVTGDRDTRLLLSSEWEFSPSLYATSEPPLDKTVLIGFPSTESGHGLVAPLAGHELGHLIWDYRSVHNQYLNKVKDQIIDAVLAAPEKLTKELGEITSEDVAKAKRGREFPDPWFDDLSRAWLWGIMQCEEYFCDLVGLHVFGEAYLHAFAYLLAPGSATRRRGTHPELRRRAAAMEKAAEPFSLDGAPISSPEGYSRQFEGAHAGRPEVGWESVEQMRASLFQQTEPDRFLLDLSDAAGWALIGDLIESVRQHEVVSMLTCRSEQIVQDMLEGFRARVPPNYPVSLANIMIAGWRAAEEEEDFWPGGKSDEQLYKKRERVRLNLDELVLKSVENLEFHSRVEPICFSTKAPSTP